ncbi:hypothetical protein [Actinomadura macrotermitis]|uniref:Uncharacterized protein n=1 Tax=Actinomadura macrotermitis TaxID=2585200 RepID=A0A7K0BXW8_9ACTN|nr:hypothetical protein [Actinomadura macrotermitis]MQY06031.1 hypothetical protein [Actinomadura macrotermitis]
MYVIRLPDGTLRVPHGVLSDPGTGDAQIVADAYVEIGPDDPDYERLLAGSLTEAELEDKRRGWRAGNDDLERTFEEWKAAREDD